MAYLVYVKSFSNPKKGLTGVTAEKWPQLLRDMSGQIRAHVGKRELNNLEAQLCLHDLVEMFPPPIQEVTS